MSVTSTTLQGNRMKIDKMNKTDLQEEVKMHHKNELNIKKTSLMLERK